MALTETQGISTRRTVAFAGGVGGAKLAQGLAFHLEAPALTVIVNTGDDFRHYGLYISPDLDTVMYTLAGIANPTTGWGIVDDTRNTLAMLEKYGEMNWFGIGDRDIATHLLRSTALQQGERLTTITEKLCERLQIPHRILPATDERLATIVHTQEYGALPFQEYFVKHRWQPTVTQLVFEGADQSRPSAEAFDAITQAEGLVICPSNPLLSIAPILAIPRLRQTLENRHQRCIAVSPLIHGQAVKGPTDKIMKEMHLTPSTYGIAQFYEGLIDGLVVDEGDTEEVAAVQADFPTLKVYQTAILMKSLEDRQRLAAQVLTWLYEG